jgi:hypothetical protein
MFSYYLVDTGMGVPLYNRHNCYVTLMRMACTPDTRPVADETKIFPSNRHNH